MERMTSMTLYEVTKEGMELTNILTEMDGELTPELEGRLDAFLKAGKDKINAAACVVRELEAKEKACAEEVQRLSQRSAMFAREASALKSRILAAVDMAFDGKVKTAMFTVWGQSSAPTVAIELAPDADLKEVQNVFPGIVRTKLELDKAAIKHMLSNGDPLPGAVTVTEHPGTRYLRIK